MAYFFIIALLVIQGLLFSSHLLVYMTVVSVFGIGNSNAILILKIAMAVLCVSFIISSLVSSRYYDPVSKALYVLSASWLAILFYLFLASAVYWAGRAVFPGFFESGAGSLAGRALLVVGLLVGIYGIFHSSDTKIKTVKVSLPNLPVAWQGRKAVFVSDLHLGGVRGRDFAERVVGEINSVAPAAVFIGGDLYDGQAVDEGKVVEPLSGIRAGLGTYFITGNHEEFSDSAKYLEAVRAAGVKVLSNEAVDVDGVTLAGVDYRDGADKSRFEEVLEGLKIDRTKPSILLKHDPLKLEIAEKYGISMQISGHTHRAQMFPLNLITHLIYRGYDYGLKDFGSMKVYTSSGVGTWGPPSRVGTDSEIVVLEFNQ